MSFYKSTFKLSSATTVAQILPFLALPFLARIYDKEQFGLAAIFLSIGLILGNAISLRLEASLYHGAHDKNRNNTITLTFILFTITSFLYSATIAAFSLESIYYIAIFLFLLIALTNIEVVNKNVTKKFNQIGISNIARTSILVISQLIFGYLGFKYGLIYGIVLSFLVYYLLLSEPFKFTKFNEIKIFVSESMRIIKYTFPGMILNTLNGNIPNIMLLNFYGTEKLGIYSMVTRILGAPSSLIGSAISNVYSGYASTALKKEGSLFSIFKKTIILSSLLGIIGFGIFYLNVDFIIKVFLGDQWLETIPYIKILIFYFFVNFVVVAISSTDLLLKRNYFYLIFNIVLLLIILSYFLNPSENIEGYLIYISIFGSAAYAIYGFACFMVARKK